MREKTLKMKVTSIALVIAMIIAALGVMTLTNSTAYAAEDEITVYVTVSNAGELGTLSDGSAAANLPVIVPADADGTATVDTALKALHETYCPDGYVTSESAYGLAVNKLWGIENGGSYLFAINGVGCSSGVGYDLIGEGQHLTAVVMKDLTYWSDLIASFDQTAVTTKVGEQVELALTYDAVTYDADWNAAHVATPVAGATVSAAGEVVATTDAEGKVFVSFDEAGTYVVTASGAVTMQVQDWSQGGAYVDADAPISAPACVITVEAVEEEQEEQAPGGTDEGVVDPEGETPEQDVQEDEPAVDEEDEDVQIEEEKPVVDEEVQVEEEEPAVEEDIAEEETPAVNEDATENESEKAPATGDASQMAMYLLMFIAAAGTAFAVKKQK